MNHDCIELFTTIGRNWLDYAWMFVASVRKHTDAYIHYTVLCDWNDPEAEAFGHWATRNGVSLHIVDFSASVARRAPGFLATLPTPPNTLSKCVYWGRYCARECLAELPQRFIYADVDMLAMADLAPLMSIDLAGAPVGAVRYPNDAAVASVGIPAGTYVNNGLLVFDTAAFDGPGCVAAMQRALRSGRTVFGPQCAFNVAMQGRIALLDNVWNVQGDWRAQLTSSARLIHFTGNTKPWHALSADPLRWQVRDLLRELGCTQAWRPDLNPAKALRLAARRMRAAWQRA